MPEDTRMEFWTTLVGLMRRSRVLIPAVLLGLALGLGAYVATPTTYVSDTTMVLTTTQYGGTESQDPTKPTDLTNPVLNFNESLRTTSSILIEAMGTKAVLQELGAHGATRLSVNDGRSNPNLLGPDGPFVYIEVQSGSAGEAQRIVSAAEGVIKDKLRELQETLNAPLTTYVGLVEVVPPSVAEPRHGRAVAHGLLGFLIAFLLRVGFAYAWQQLRLRRRARDAAARTAPKLAADAGPSPARSPAPSPVLTGASRNGTALATTKARARST